MGKETIVIKEIKEAKTKAGKPMWWIKDENDVDYCAFEHFAIDGLKEGYENVVDIDHTGNKPTIRNFFEVKNQVEVITEKIVTIGQAIEKASKVNTMPKDPVGLAVKVFNTLVNKGEFEGAIVEIPRKAAIEVVKDIQKAFE